MSDLAKYLLKAFARKLLAMLGTFLVTHDMLTGPADAFVNKYLDVVVGGALVLISAGWTTAYQWYVKRKVVAALALPAGASPAKLEEVVSGKP